MSLPPNDRRRKPRYVAVPNLDVGNDNVAASNSLYVNQPASGTEQKSSLDYTDTYLQPVFWENDAFTHYTYTHHQLPASSAPFGNSVQHAGSQFYPSHWQEPRSIVPQYAAAQTQPVSTSESTSCSEVFATAGS